MEQQNGMESPLNEEISQGVPATSHARRDFAGSFVGLLVFFGGVALLLLTFKLCYDLFKVPPASALGIQKNQAVDLGRAGDSLVSLLIRILMLILMAVIGSMIANRGISLYVGSRPHRTRFHL